MLRTRGRGFVPTPVNEHTDDQDDDSPGVELSVVPHVGTPQGGPGHEDEPHDRPEHAVEGVTQVVSCHEHDEHDEAGADGEQENNQEPHWPLLC